MHTKNPNVLKNLIRQIKPYICEKSLEISEWKSYTGVHSAPGVIELDSAPAQIMRLGEHYRVGYDDTRYFEAEITVPQDFANRRVYLALDFGGEGIVRINGKIVGAVSSRENSGWVGRTEIIFPVPLQGGERLFIQLENAVDSGGFCDTAMGGGKSMEYTLSCAALQLINEQTQSLWFDFDCAFDIYEHSEDKYAAKKLYNAVDSAIHLLDFDCGRERFYASVGAAAEFFKQETAKINFATPGEVLMCGHSHLDVAWLWTVNEITRKTARTFANNLALMDAYPDFRFTQSQAVLYDFIKRYYPELYGRVREKIKSGQWEITGNAWVEADTNIASGESLVRQLLYGRKFFMEEFGVSSEVYWLPDCFGFTAALPQIIKKAGMKYFITSKLQNNDTNEFPQSVFKWRSHSGDEVLAYMQKVHYEGEADAEYIRRARATNRQFDLTDISMGMFGYGDGGGGVTYNMTERMRRWSSLPGLPAARQGSSAEFFKKAEKAADELPVWDGEMYYENHRGTFTSQAFVKRNNRKGEIALRNAELLSLISGDYPAEKIRDCWNLLLINQFHDILPGTSIHEVFENTRCEYEKMNAGLREITESRLKALSERFSASGAVIVWNFNSHKVSGAVFAENCRTALADAAGKPALCKLRENGLEFIAEDVPGMGYKIYYPANNTKTAAVTATKSLLENEYLRVSIDENGLLDSVYDKENSCELLSGKGNLLTLSHDKPVHESAWNLENDYQMSMKKLTAAESVELCESSAVRGAVRVVRRFESSVITQEIRLGTGSRRIDFVSRVDWHEREKILKAEFPVNVRARYSTFEIAHGAVERPTFANNPFEQAMFECCAHKWTDLSEGGGGVSLLNDCKYGYDISGSVMRISLMRGPVCPDPTGDIGVSEFTYSLYPHSGSWRDAGTVNEAFSLNNPLCALYTPDAKGENSEYSFIKLSADNVIIDAVKAAEDKNGAVIRVYEALSKRTECRIELPFKASVSECNLMEDFIREIPCENGVFSFTVKPYELLSFRIRRL